jgi:hypothetical protein
MDLRLLHGVKTVCQTQTVFASVKREDDSNKTQYYQECGKRKKLIFQLKIKQA